MLRHDFYVSRDVHSQDVYLAKESLTHFLSAIFYHNHFVIFLLYVIIFHPQLINSSHADSAMADKKRVKLSS